MHEQPSLVFLGTSSSDANKTPQITKMKLATGIAVVVLLTFLAYSDAGVQKLRFEELVAPVEEQNCKCIPSLQCKGEVNGNVYCQPWYGFVCCVNTPQPQQQSINAENDIQVIHA